MLLPDFVFALGELVRHNVTCEVCEVRWQGQRFRHGIVYNVLLVDDGYLHLFHESEFRRAFPPEDEEQFLYR
ncbi:hypothetical protein DLM85_23025 [Hymenobacter edaphi]|uniref:Uncharacterized protein n=1 Tax=Hymenobacter edaphi TaxID=2211146 RepID=A0A328B7E8_9BACT|nr:hypothetical protein DLM85_23025 [Hymenobacter edaphi]